MKKLLLLIAGISAISAYSQTTFNTNGTGRTGSIQQYIVPDCVTELHITARGAQGGNTNGGLGAEMTGDFSVTTGDTIFIVVGQQGTVNTCGGPNASSGGGGGSFVWKNTGPGRILLLVAGGGGGGNMNWGDICRDGIAAVTTNDGTQGNGGLSAMGGTGGQGGFGNAPSGTGSGGAGWLSNGQNSTYMSGCTGGETYPIFLGGFGLDIFSAPGEGEGGFGGGGGAVCGNGGGGGYSGGGGGEGSSCRAGGGGGGSYNIGTNQVNADSVQIGNGVVIIAPNTGATGDITGTLTPNDTVCAGELVTATASNGSAFVWNNGITNAVPFTATTSNTYMLTGLTMAGCADTFYINLHVYTLPDIQYNVTPDDTVCVGTSVTAMGTGGTSYLWDNGITDNTPFNAIASDTYTVTGTDANGCSNTATLELTVSPNPIVNLGTDIVQTNPPVVLDAGSGFTSYLWNTTETTQTISVSTNGNYFVTVTNASGCTDVDTIQVTFTAGIDGNSILSNVKIYPNPTHNIVWIDTDLSPVNIQVTDMNGKVIIDEKNITAGDSNIDLTNYAPGTYILCIEVNEMKKYTRIIKE